jgi:hypothetical protein
MVFVLHAVSFYKCEKCLCIQNGAFPFVFIFAVFQLYVIGTPNHYSTQSSPYIARKRNIDRTTQTYSNFGLCAVLKACMRAWGHIQRNDS